MFSRLNNTIASVTYFKTYDEYWKQLDTTSISTVSNNAFGKKLLKRREQSKVEYNSLKIYNEDVWQFDVLHFFQI